MDNEATMPRLLLHVCCATCGAFVLDELRREYLVTAYYYNPNIYPETEYRIRMTEVRDYCERHGIPFVEEAPDRKMWYQLVRGHEGDPERGFRCTICYHRRLFRTAEYAAAHRFEVFTTDLSISPHKDAVRLNHIGRGLARRFGVRFLEADFKKRDGFRQAMAISRREGFYRQSYCGCEYSLKKTVVADQNQAS